MKKKFYLLIFIVFSLLLVGCSDTGETTKSKEQVNEEEELGKQEKDKVNDKISLVDNKAFENLPKLPEDTMGLVQQLPGEYANEDVLTDENEQEIIEKIKNLPSMPTNGTEDEYNKYFQYIYSLAATDFPNPEDIVNKWEFSMYGNPNLPDSKYQFKDNYNIEIILDSSGSMGFQIDGKTQMELAKEAINEFVSNVPEEANISLRVYGHKGTGDDSDKAMSCSSTEQVYGFKKYNKESFNQALNQFQPSGWTPIAGALKESMKEFKDYNKETNTNLIYLVSDGIETCNGDPVEVAKSFANSNISPIINVIGFNVDSEAQVQLQKVAESAKGIYTTVSNGEQLKNEFERAQEILERWESWKSDALSDAEAEEIDNSFDILGFSNDWNYIADGQSLNISYLITIFREQGKLTFEQADHLKDKASQMEQLIENSREEILKDLNSVNDTKIEDLKQQINEKYNTNTQT
jgi:Ca-activated chloride channel homolog